MKLTTLAISLTMLIASVLMLTSIEAKTFDQSSLTRSVYFFHGQSSFHSLTCNKLVNLKTYWKR